MLCRTGCTIDVANSLASGTEPLPQYAGFARRSRSFLMGCLTVHHNLTLSPNSKGLCSRILIPQAVGLPSASGGYRRVFGKIA
jgi:hypothetical protein